ncbi:MAG: FCD domain-containing protein [Deltaproteobacteria bacterium]|nr:FCD domain-containing protein [Deltaproteobacteria bacterium]
MLPAASIKSNLKRETLVGRIVDILEERILAGELLPGSRLSEGMVASQFGVSKTPAREALQRLEEMKLVRKTHLVREVAEFSLQEFHEIYELKNVVEAFGVMQGSLNASDRDLSRIQSVLDKMNDVTDDGDLAKLRYFNSQFHDLLVGCSGNQKVIETYAMLAKQVRWTASRSLSLPERPRRSTREHQAIFQAFRLREARRVRNLMEKHTNAAMARIISRLKSEQAKKNRAGEHHDR